MEQAISQAVAAGKLLPESQRNIQELLASSSDPVCRASVEELVESGKWEELNDRFFRKLAFGTGGLRGRTIGKLVTKAEQGRAAAGERPEFPCVGTNCVNYYNLGRATQGLIAYLKKTVPGGPAIVFSHDTRHFSRQFAEFCAKNCRELGLDVYLFDSHRATPELSFAVRHFRANAGVMLTASHNPPHDNGYKVYFGDGGLIVDPGASQVIAEVNAISKVEYSAPPESEQGELRIIGPEIDELYMARLDTLVLQPELLRQAQGLKIVYTALHGVGAVIVPQMLRKLGFDFRTVALQDKPSGAFPTVKSPNPEESAALQMAIDLAEKEGADIVLGTDPDCDRMGAAARDEQGKLVLISGNQIGSLLAYYRAKTFFEKGVLTKENAKNGAIIKTYVTTNLQAAIANKLGLHYVNTLTGFKYIGAKLAKYEKAVPLPEGQDYRDLSEAESRALRLKHSKFFVFGGEESFGYLGADFIRDKDGNGAVVMFCELASYAKSRGLTIPGLLDEIYREFGYFQEVLKSKTMEGADGIAKIKKLANSYTQSPPSTVDGSKVVKVRNFAAEDILDEEGDLVPKEQMIMVEMEDGRSWAVRPSGTEPKIKYYLYGSAPAGAADLVATKASVSESLDRLWTFIDADIAARVGG